MFKIKNIPLIIFLIIQIFLYGCSNNSLPLEPVAKGDILSLNKIESGDEIISDNISHKIIRTKRYTIDGSKGGVIYLKEMWKSGKFNGLKLEAKLKIPRNAFPGKLTFDIIMNPKQLSIQLFPSPFTFDIPVLLDLKYKGIDLSYIDSTNIDFSYISPSGDLEPTEYDFIQIDTEEASLFVHNAVLPHFSRYGWTR